ncbi:hypothetical protein EMPS_09306 [Entomortierella parvispora]|uniref:Uncharacterized protein n=1 Tax=Entomortierella parvispora TaxID=205924 RepID=A0A9P3HHX8_9FUNG|nr:hypothetical protein EMPS_09306 [Entomortierella parvispora]
MKSTFLSSTVAFFLLGTATTFLSTTTEAALDQCTLSLAGLLADPGLNQCLPLQQLSLLLTENITTTLVNTTATQFCAYPVCSQATVTLVENTITQNCVNATDPATSDLVYGAAQLYQPFKDGLCTRDVLNPPPSGNGTFCITELAGSLTAYMALHPSPLGIEIFANATVLQQYVAGMPTDLLCTPCNKAIINPLDNYIAQNKASLNAEVLRWADVIQTEVQIKCGPDFTNGVAPTNNNTSGSKSAALSAFSVSSSSSLIVAATAAVSMVMSAGALFI